MHKIRLGQPGEFQFVLKTVNRFPRKLKKSLKSLSSDDVLAELVEMMMHDD
jgi:hypothetical protein